MSINEKIKLVIWDLDETFWNGTLSEGAIEAVEKNIKIVKELTDRGIVNSICSKNDFETAKEKLIELGIWDYFIFPKISWAPKGEAVKAIIEEAQLRDVNTLFLDDNHLNLEEVKFYNKDINLGMPEIIPTLLESKNLKGKDDREHSRLKQYKVLESKKKEEKNFDSNEEFLKECEIEIKFIHNCINYFDRIYELVERTNQLNFTKKRISKEELQNLLNNEEIKSACIHVKDKYGDYGIVGFYALKTNELEHFIFSCRILNLGIPQYIFENLDKPYLKIEESVAEKLDKFIKVDWITEVDEFIEVEKKHEKENNKKLKILIRGGCDLDQISPYLYYKNLDIETEFNYNSEDGIPIHREHSEILRSSFYLNKQEKSELIRDIPFYDEHIFDTSMFEKKYDYVIYSVLMDYTQAIYKSESNNKTVVYGDFKQPLTDINAKKKKFMTDEFMKSFRNEFEFTGGLSKKRFIENLEWIKSKLSVDTKLIIINGSEINLEHEFEKNRCEHHIEMNKALDEFLMKHKDVYLVDVRKIAITTNDVTNNIRHYKRNVYKKLADELVKIFESESSINVEINRKKFLKTTFNQIRKKLKI